MDERPHDVKLRALAERLANGEYSIDPQLVADAILARARELMREKWAGSEGVLEAGE